MRNKFGANDVGD